MNSIKNVFFAFVVFSLSFAVGNIWSDETVPVPATGSSTVLKNKSKTNKPSKTKSTKINKKAGSTATLKNQEEGNTKKKSSVQVWLNKLKKKIASTQSKQNKLVAVAAVRGDETPDSPPLYWKGKSSEGPVAMPELKEFDDAINLALDGDNAGAKTKLESFVSTYPKSHMIDDAQQTLKMLNEEPVTP